MYNHMKVLNLCFGKGFPVRLSLQQLHFCVNIQTKSFVLLI